MTTLRDRADLMIRLRHARADAPRLPDWLDEAARLTVVYDDATPDADARPDWLSLTIASLLIFGPIVLLALARCIQ